MTRKKSSFLTFCFSLLPGAGQMYMGFMRRGSSLMALFFLTIFLSTWLELGPLMFLMPIIWFYAFFDTHNLRAMPDDEFYSLEDEFILLTDLTSNTVRVLREKYRYTLALLLIIIGVSILWNNFLDLLHAILPSFLYSHLRQIGRTLPQLLVAFIIIALGLYLIRGKKQDLDAADYGPADYDHADPIPSDYGPSNRSPFENGPFEHAASNQGQPDQDQSTNQKGGHAE